MPDWRSSMQQTYEYYVVDPVTLKDIRRIETVRSCSITRDLDVETLGSATIDLTESIGECYIRAYLVTIQNGIRERFPLGTFLVQTPLFRFNGAHQEISADAYTPLVELKEKSPPLGYSILEGENIMNKAYLLCRENTRVPAVEVSCSSVLPRNFVANTNDTWLTFIRDFISNAKYAFDLDELGRILYSPKQDIASMQPVWTYTDDDSSILYPEVSLDRDLYGIPNVIEVTCTRGFYDEDVGQMAYVMTVENNDPNSPVSIQNRGRVIPYREVDPNIAGSEIILTKSSVRNYVDSLLRSLSSLTCTVTYTHGYCPARVGDCVRLHYERAGLRDIKAKVMSQTIKCEPGCPVTEKASFVMKLWG